MPAKGCWLAYQHQQQIAGPERKEAELRYWPNQLFPLATQTYYIQANISTYDFTLPCKVPIILPSRCASVYTSVGGRTRWPNTCPQIQKVEIQLLNVKLSFHVKSRVVARAKRACHISAASCAPGTCTAQTRLNTRSSSCCQLSARRTPPA